MRTMSILMALVVIVAAVMFGGSILAAEKDAGDEQAPVGGMSGCGMHDSQVDLDDESMCPMNGDSMQIACKMNQADGAAEGDTPGCVASDINWEKMSQVCMGGDGSSENGGMMGKCMMGDTGDAQADQDAHGHGGNMMMGACSGHGETSWMCRRPDSDESDSGTPLET